VQTAGHRLAVTLGNHDLELALPWVREHLLDLLAGDDDTARGRIILAFDGAGFLCRAGNATVLCVHGNEIDPWNVTDHEVIRRTGRDLQQGRAVQPWIPNAGTYLVIDVMNDIKKEHPFIDLLKPEREAVLPVLLSVAPEKRDRILSVWPIYQRLRQDTDRLRKGLLGDEDEPSDLRSGPLPPPRPPMDHDALMGETEDLLTRRVEPITLVPDAYSEQTLGLGGALWSWASGGDSRVTLRLALEDLQNDRSFDWRLQDEMFRKFDETVTAGIDFVLCGHTHLERALPRRKGSGFYFNSGTWVRLIQLKPEVLGDQQAFNKVYDALAAGTLEALDAFEDLVLRPRTVIAVRPGATGSRGELLHWDMASGELIKVADEAGKTKT
jgi:hypothetical protein